MANVVTGLPGGDVDGAAFPIYAAEGWPARISGSGSDGDELTHLKIAHAPTLPELIVIHCPPIEVTTSIEPHRPATLVLEPIAGPNARLLGPQPDEL